MQLNTFVFEIEAEFCPGLCVSGRVKLPFCLDAPLQPPWSIFFSSFHHTSSYLTFVFSRHSVLS